MDIIGQLDKWYKEWSGHSHLEDSNRQIFDSADAQDFARYCVETALKENEQVFLKKIVSQVEKNLHKNYNAGSIDCELIADCVKVTISVISR